MQNLSFSHFENSVKHKNVKMLICRSRLNQKDVGDTKCRSDLVKCVEGCVSNQTSWVTIIRLWDEGYHWRCRVFDKSMDVTIASGPILIVRVLPGQQVMVHCRNSVKIDDSFNSFFIGSIFM